MCLMVVIQHQESSIQYPVSSKLYFKTADPVLYELVCVGSPPLTGISQRTFHRLNGFYFKRAFYMTVATDGMGNCAFTKNGISQPFTSHKCAEKVKGKAIWVEKHSTERNVVGHN